MTQEDKKLTKRIMEVWDYTPREAVEMVRGIRKGIKAIREGPFMS